jgi:hypothetical protein
LLTDEIKKRKDLITSLEKEIKFVKDEESYADLVQQNLKKINQLNSEISIFENKQNANKTENDNINNFIKAEIQNDKIKKNIADINSLVTTGNYDEITNRFDESNNTLNSLKSTREKLLNQNSAFLTLKQNKNRREEIEKLNSEISENTAYRDILKNSLLANLQG